MCFPKQPKPADIPAYQPPAQTEKKEAAVKVAAPDSQADVEVNDKRRRKVSTALGL